MTATAILLAAGLGTRMRSEQPKALHRLGGRPMLAHLIASCEAVFDRIVIVVGPEQGAGMAALRALCAPHPVVVQAERRGTAHAALQAAAQFGDGEVAVLYADNPMIGRDTLARLLTARRQGAAMALLAMRPADPARYGRVIVEKGAVRRIVEWADASEAERGVGLCNAGVISAPAEDLRRWLGAVRNANAKGEFYLTDVVAMAVGAGRVVAVEAPEAELRGINSRVELAEAEASLQAGLRRAAMEGGATLVAPETVFLAWDTTLAPDVVVGPHVVFGPGVSVGSGAEILPFSHLEGARVAAGARIGPFARLRPGTSVGEAAHVGNFVELKATHLADGAKANHLAYLGDAEIGPRSNIGAGTITCNYDGFVKHRTVIGADVFVGSDSVLVAPLSLGDGALIAAGSVVTASVPPDAMAFGRARQRVIEGRAALFRAEQAPRGQAPEQAPREQKD